MQNKNGVFRFFVDLNVRSLLSDLNLISVKGTLGVIDSMSVYVQSISDLPHPFLTTEK
jgi:hypothetical protein